jgi:hypothetical protein
MFETPEEVKQKEPKGFWIGIAVVILVVAGAAVFYTMWRGGGQKPAAATAARPKVAADPIRDLKVQRATMTKDRTGTTAAWLVTIENHSPDYTYSKIKYETSYVGADDHVILVNQGTIEMTIGPGGESNAQFNDALYPVGTAWYKFKLVGATASTQ